MNREIEIYDYLRTVQSDHASLTCMRALSDRFEINSTGEERYNNAHTCLVLPPFVMSVDQLISRLPGGVLTSHLLKACLRNLLAALDFLHTEAHIIHTDIRPKNILLGIEDYSILSFLE